MNKVVSRKEMLRFILSQPDDREVDFGNNTPESECGCVMIQYAAKNIPQKLVRCSVYCFVVDGPESNPSTEDPYFAYWPGFRPEEVFSRRTKFNYAELKRYARVKFPGLCKEIESCEQM